MHKTFWKKNNSLTYRRKRCRCNLNHMHDSMFEARHCNHLGLLKKAGEIADFKSQPRYTMYVNKRKVCSHYPDFLIYHNDGKEEIHECKSKGTVTDVWKLKRALFECLYPDIPYTVVWMN